MDYENDTESYEALTTESITIDKNSITNLIDILVDNDKASINIFLNIYLKNPPASAFDKKSEKTEQQKTPLKPKAQKRSEDPEVEILFQRFWSLYPKKTSKVQAEKAWRSQANECVANAEKILADVQRRIDHQWPDTPKQFIPYPSSYLNKRLWEDEWESEAQTSGTVETWV